MNVLINKKKLENLIEPHLYKNLTEDKYEIKHIKSDKLLTYNRLDIAFKLLYLEMLEHDVKYAKEIYIQHIKAFSLGEFIEPGNNEKNSVERFIDDFNSIYESIMCSGFDSKKTLVPLSKNNSIVNGAHRVASAIYLHKNVDCIQLDIPDYRYDYKFFYARNISNDILDAVVTKFVQFSSNIHIAFVWPTAIGNDNKIEEIIPNIVYRKDIQLNPNGAHNLLSQIYYGEEWLGSIENNFRGSQGKLVECFRSFDPIRVIAFQTESLNDVLKIKDDIRDVFNVGKHSIHITDTKDEAIRTARIVFNDNSIHFLNYAKPNKYMSTHKKTDTFKAFLKMNNLSVDDVLLDSSIVLSAYGLREANDTDFFCSDNHKIKVKFDDINTHDEELKYYDENKNEMIYNQKFYFYFNDMKFTSFNQLYKMKTNRDEEKDKNDCNMMEALIENNRRKEYVTKIRQNIYYEKIKLRKKIVIVLQNIGLYKVTRNIYRLVKGKK